MTLNSYKNNPDYPDRYTRNKQWTKVLPVQGRPIQTAELIEVQSILQDNIKQGLNTVYKNGSVVKGLRVSINSFSNTLSLLISSGQIYIEGQILDVSESVINVPSEGLYNINVSVSESIIDETIDPSLRDPIKGAFTIGTPGASRLVWTTSINFSREGEFVVNSYSIAQVNNGIILQKDSNPFYQVEKSLAQFVYEKNGNFCVEGFEPNYIGFDKKVGSDISKQEELQSLVQQTQDEQQRALSNATTLQTRISNLESQLNQANLNSIVDKATYQPIIARLTNELIDARLIQAQYSEDLIDTSKALQAASSDLKNIEALITDQQIVAISPGIAYVEGYRIAINSAAKLYIPQSFPTKTVENASFTYRAESSQSLRTFSLRTEGQDIINFENTYTTIELTFDDINNNVSITPEINTNKFSVEVVYNITQNSNLLSTLTNLQNILRGTASIPTNCSIKLKDEEQLLSPEILTKTTLNGTSVLTAEEKRNILSKYIETTLAVDTLVFKATSFTLKPTDISITSISKIYNSSTNNLLNFTSNLLINPTTGSLSEELSKSTYKLGFSPVNKITRLTSDLQIEASIIRSQSGIDPIQNEDSVLSIDSIEYQEFPGGPIITYSSPLDYKLTRNNVEWELTRSNVIPKAGSSYRIKYTYTEVLVQDVDYVLDRNTDSIIFIGRTPKIDGRFNVDYSYFLSKAGVITLDKNGNFGFSLSAAAKNPVVPSISKDKLSLATFIVNSKNIELKKSDCKRQTVKDLYDLAQDINTNKENNESLKLDLETLQNVVVNSEEEPIGIFSTTFNNLSKINTLKSTVAFIPGIQAATNGFHHTELNITVLNNGQPNQLRNPTNEIEYVTIPFTEVLLLNQPRATTTIEVKPLDKSIKSRANLYISEKIIFKNQGKKSKKYSTINDLINPSNPPTIVETDEFTMPNLTSCDPLTKQGLLFSSNNSDSNLVQSIQANIRSTMGNIANTISSDIQKGTPTTISNLNSNTLLQDAYNNVYTKEIEIDVFIDNLPSNEKEISLLLDGSTLKIESNKVLVGAVNNLNFGINANIEGRAVFKIKLPENILTGTHTLELIKPNRVYAKTNFYVYNTLLNQIVITPVKNWNAQPLSVSACDTVPLNKLDVYSEDLRLLGIDSNASSLTTKEVEFPLRHKHTNQTFVLPQTNFLTSLELKINKAPKAENDSSLQVYLTSSNEIVPIKDLLATSKSTNLVETTISNSVEGEYSKFKFNSLPLLSKNTKYNIALETISPKNLPVGYEVYTAIIDDENIVDNSIVGNQLYLEGDLFTSVDGTTLHQKEKESLTYKLYGAEFNQNYTLDLGSFSVLSGSNTTDSTINYFCLNTRDIIPEGTDVIYKYSLDESRSNKISFKPNSTICLNNEVNVIYLEAELITNFKNVAPQVLVKGSTVSLYTVKNTSELISKQVKYPEAYKSISITLQNIKPAGTDIKVFYSPGNGYDFEGPEWIELTLDSSKTSVVNTALQLYQSTYSKVENSQFYYSTVNRTDFKYKIVLFSKDGLTPLVRNITTIVS